MLLRSRSGHLSWSSGKLADSLAPVYLFWALARIVRATRCCFCLGCSCRIVSHHDQARRHRHLFINPAQQLPPHHGTRTASLPDAHAFVFFGAFAVSAVRCPAYAVPGAVALVCSCLCVISLYCACSCGFFGISIQPTRRICIMHQ